MLPKRNKDWFGFFFLFFYFSFSLLNGIMKAMKCKHKQQLFGSFPRLILENKGIKQQLKGKA